MSYAANLSYYPYEPECTSSAPTHYYTDAEIEAAIERALDEADQDELLREQDTMRFARGSIAEFALYEDDADIEATFFAEGDAMSEQHRAESDALLWLREATGTVKASFWRRLFSRGRAHSYA